MLHKTDCLVVSRTENFVLDSVHRARHTRQTFATSEFGMRRKKRSDVSRHFDLRHDRNKAFLRVCKDLADIVSRVEVRTVGLPIAAIVVWPTRAAMHGRFRTYSPELHKLRETIDGEPPAMVLCEMPVKHV